MNSRSRRKNDFTRQNIAVFGLLFALLIGASLIFFGLTRLGTSEEEISYQVEQIIDPGCRMGRAQLQIVVQLQKNSQRVTRDQVFKSIGPPLAKLKDIHRQTASLQQFAYPLAFAPAIQIVLVFQNEELVAYRYALDGTIPKI